jgi:hypothetical protein
MVQLAQMMHMANVVVLAGPDLHAAQAVSRAPTQAITIPSVRPFKFSFVTNRLLLAAVQVVTSRSYFT